MVTAVLSPVHNKSLSQTFPLNSQQDPKQQTILNLFQRTFSDDVDDIDETLFVEAVDACENSGPQTSSGEAEGELLPASPCKRRRIDDFFGRQ